MDSECKTAVTLTHIGIEVRCSIDPVTGREVIKVYRTHGASDDRATELVATVVHEEE